jgi:hypothetical protein
VSEPSIPSVQFAAPPHGPIRDAATRFALDAATSLKPGEDGGVFGILHTKPDGSIAMNAAVVHRVGDRFLIAGWIGKESWGQPVGFGGAAVFTWGAPKVIAGSTGE